RLASAGSSPIMPESCCSARGSGAIACSTCPSARRSRGSAEEDGTVCLGIVGRVTALSTVHPDLADVDVAGVVRPINGALQEGSELGAGDWILIHGGFAMERIDQETAERQIAALRDYVGEPEEADEEFG